MNSMQLLYAMNDMRDDYIIDAEIEPRVKRLNVWKTLGVVAACAAVVLAFWGVGSRLIQTQNPPGTDTQPPSTALTPLQLPERETGNGETSCFAYDVSELIDEDSSANKPFDKLPIFRNKQENLDFTQSGTVQNPDTAQMRQLLVDGAKRLGMDKDVSVTERRTSDENTLEAYVMENETYHLEVNTLLGAVLTFRDPAAAENLRLPREATRQDLKQAAQAAVAQFSELLGMKKPKIVLPRGEYDVNGKQICNQFSVYDCAGDALTAFLNKQFRSVRFFFDDETGCLSSVNWRFCDFSWRTDALARRAGEVYPILSLDLALAQACERFHLVHDEILYTELFYDNDSRLPVFTPYYRFFVQTDDTNIGASLPGMHTYTFYEMSALDPAYVITE